MPISNSWRTGEQGVIAFEAWCTACLWPFVRVPTERDVGIDGFVQVTSDGIPTGDVFAVQIKTGRSYLRGSAGAVPVRDHGDFWRSSSIPVVAVVHDPETGRLWWGNATEALRREPSLRTISVKTLLPPSAHGDLSPLLRSVKMTELRGGLPRGLGSLVGAEQADAVWQSFALGFNSPNALVAVRRLLAHFDTDAAREAVIALSHCTPHPDIFCTDRNFLPRSSREAVAATFSWTHWEIRALLSLILEDENGINRGSVGQCVYMLLFEDSGCVQKLETTAIDLARADPEIAGWSAYLAIVRSDEQREQWRQLLGLAPALSESFVGRFIDDALEEFGFISLD